jgi:lactate dehydrogenase-like 2-hydroxyacid dehydrogenase
VYVTRLIPQENIDELRKEFDVEVNLEDRALSPAELKEKVRGRSAVVSLLTDRIDSEILDAAGRRCRIFANYAVGYNNFDLAAATQRKIILTNTPGVLDDATATQTFMLLLATARRIAEADKFVRDGKWLGWAPMFFLGLDVDHRTLGIAGLGRIGKNVARKARGFNMRIIYNDVQRNAAFEAETGAEFVDKETLLREADFLTLHVPLLPETHHYIGAAELKKMKKTAVLINASRGPVVDEKALVTALREKWIFGAGLDVYENEPAIEPGLIGLDNVVLAPHLASATPATRIAMGNMVVANIHNVLNGLPPENCVNQAVLKSSNSKWRALF